ncbi:MAG: HD domain-containing protein, partial [Nanoarchaeota archaeon]
DIDDTVINTFKIFVDYCNKKFSKEYIGDCCEGYEIYKFFDISESEFYELFYEFEKSSFSFDNIEFFKDVKKILNELKNNHEIFFITARHEKIKNFTKMKMSLLFPENDVEIYHMDYENSIENPRKIEICNKLGVEILIEDNKKTSLNCAKEGIKCFLLDKPWNQNCEHENIIRVNDWKEIREKIRELDFKENIVEEIRKFVEEECRKPNANYAEAYENHFVTMHSTAKKLAENLEADIELVEIAAWLHDIGSIIYGRKNHHITGAKIAEDKLRELNYPEEKIEKVKSCILNHRGSQEKNNERNFIESRIIAEADVLDAFNNISKQFLITLVYEKKSLIEAKNSVKQKLINKWNQLSPEGKELIKSKYEAAMLLLG